MELATYKVTFKETKDEWIFQYRKEDGIIYNFTNLKGNRILSLLDKNQFPGIISRIEDWAKLKGILTIELKLDDYSFETFWKKYNLKQKKELCEKAYEKLSLVDKIKCFANLPLYDEFLLKTKQNKALMVTWINQKRYNDEFV
ncbi:hypothetical protein K5L04_09395 [Flavobacterium psychrophilum]|uniref:hypothetical protein n=2 Tax=Flavobacterium psychrophilum TaxID=96345 RepID=UPI00073E1BC1|nr:hypothetical protein [Flavobacterium psychrophilum]EKT4520708.1 hypothetical protein [Flavobacterium psychrophilum]EKT4551984.1 hypothetical protein [Flavobacterium psychrophilum]ELV7524950.1 hypothetical protein [Flavobacterium psychrophilum]ELY1979216.1 hypothetical protein [Flavobacterium psychrophilum]MBF2024353.1 hypothetical protein [Flavobacterium psychrophilum]